MYGEISNATFEAGGIVGNVHYGATISNCAFIGDVHSENRAGGIAGSVYAVGTISNCYHLGYIDAQKHAGGIVGIVRFGEYGKDNENTLIENCYHASGTISGAESSGIIVGTCSYYDGIQNKVIINNCYGSSDSSANAGECGATTDTSIIIRPSEVMTIATDLGKAYKNNDNASFNDGYPVFTWQTVSKSESVKYGDTNGDNSIDIMDVIAINKYLLGTATLSAEERIAADVDGNAVIDPTDSLIILKCVVELIDATALPLS